MFGNPRSNSAVTVVRVGSRTKNGPSAKSSGRGTGSHVASGRGLRSLGHLGGAGLVPPCARKLLAVESATNTQRPGNAARWGWPL